jgi:hypothetical protein
MNLNIDLSLVQMFRETFGPGWTIEDDRRFWTRIQGRQGLCELRKDAKALEAICKELSNNPTDQEFMKHRLQLMIICVNLSRFETTARMISTQFPHFFARFAAEIFCEMLGRAQLIIEEKAPQLLGIFGETNGQATLANTNSTPPGRAAPGALS